MNIQVQLCGLFILVLLFIFYKSHKTLQLYKEKVFYRTLCIMIASLSLDILSVGAIHYRHGLPDLFVEFVCKAYIVLLVWGAYAALVYVFCDIYSEKEHKNIVRKLSLFTFVQSIIVFLLPIYIFDDGNAVYTYGAATACVYIFVGLNIIGTIGVSFVFSKRLNPRKRFAIMLWMIIWIVCAGIQFFNSELLIVGFASAVGMLIIFAIMENPEANLERRLGCFNSYALVEYLKPLMESKDEFGVLEISFEKQSYQEEQEIDSYEMIRQILCVLDTDSDILVFKNVTLGLVLISKDVEKLRTAGKNIVDDFSDYDIFHKEAMMVLVEQAAVFGDMDELFHFLSFVHTEYANNKGHLFVTNDDMLLKYREQYLMQQEITTALSEDRVEVFLHPIYSNVEQSFTSAEALVRIRKKDGSLLLPGNFIPIAEDSGQILELGERVIEKVCVFLKNSDAINLGIHYIEVNLSVIQCEKKDLAQRLISIVEKYDINPGWINLEITETASISAKTVLLENMKQLIKYGFSFSLDDFGKGESNLMYIVEMPVSIVKLDYDMSKAFFTSLRAKRVVKAVVSMVHDMDLKLVAEGIETQDEIDAMHDEGMDYIQGYYYSRPLPMNEFLDFCRQNRNG